MVGKLSFAVEIVAGAGVLKRPVEADGSVGFAACWQPIELIASSVIAVATEKRDLKLRK